jgi:Lon protease-like protein
LDDYPGCLGVFPLPHVVLFPHVHLPLHVFEPRYRALLEGAKDDSDRFVLAVLKPGWEPQYNDCPPVHDWGCAGRIVDRVRLPDGCSDIIFKGERVVRIEEFVQEAPYRRARVTALPEQTGFGQTGCTAERVDEIRTLLERACPGAIERLESCLVHPPEEDGGLELMHTLAMNLPVDLDRKLSWLAAGGTLARWQAIRSTLGRLAAARELRGRVLRQYEDVRPDKPGRN